MKKENGSKAATNTVVAFDELDVGVNPLCIETTRKAQRLGRYSLSVELL